MGNIKRVLFATLLLAIQITVQAQNTTTADTEGFMRSDGKIYVVMAVVLTILAGFLFYIVRLDRKIGKLEKQQP